MPNCMYLNVRPDGTYALLATGEMATHTVPPGRWHVTGPECVGLVPPTPQDSEGLPRDMLPKTTSWCYRTGELVWQYEDTTRTLRRIPESDLPPSRWEGD